MRRSHEQFVAGKRNVATELIVPVRFIPDE
jgi:hypothetical protein